MTMDSTRSVQRKIAFWAILVFGVAVSATDARVVGVDANGNYWEADPLTAVGTLLGSTGITDLGSLAADSANTLYTADRAALYTLDFDDGLATMVTPITLGSDMINIQALAFDNDGSLYAANVKDASQTSDLWQIDLKTGVGTMVGNVGLWITAMDFRDDTMYAYSIGVASAAGPGLGTLDMTSATYSDLEASVPATDVHGISFKAPIFPGAATPRCCELFGAGSSRFGMDPFTGEVLDIGPIDAAGGTTLVGIEGFFAVPEPASATTALLALGLLGFASRRQ